MAEISQNPKPRLTRHTRVIAGMMIGLSAVILAAAVWFTRRAPVSPDDSHAPRVIYLAPADAYARNLFRADLGGERIEQLTAVEDGIVDFAASPDGQQIAYSQNNPDGTTDIWLLDLDNRVSRPLTRCVRAVCTDPAWKPDGTQILYQRQEFNTGQTSLSWTWVVDVNTVQTRLLFDDLQLHGADPIWSPDGRRVAVFDGQAQVIRVFDVATGTDTVIDSAQGVSGIFSPDGSKLVFPVLVRGAIGQEFYTHLDMVDFETLSNTRVTGERDMPVEDASAAWSPDGTKLALARRYLDTRYTVGRQIYLLDLASGSVEPLVVDAAYNHAGIRWDSAGRRIVFQRFSLAGPDAVPEVWVYDLDTGELIRVAENAFLPAWGSG
jgi:Tol biopolymer transport system component